MKATRQLWLAVLLVMALLLACTTALSTHWAQQALLNDLAAQTGRDTQAILAQLAAPSAGALDTSAGLPAQVAPQRYERIQITRYDGTILAAGNNATDTAHARPAPGWFVRLFKLHIPPAQAPVLRNGKTVGLLTLEANTAPVVNTLWQLAVQTAALFAAAALVMAILATAIVQRIVRGVRNLTRQAEALTGGSYAPLEEASAPEVAPAARALNNLGASMETRLAAKNAPAKTAHSTEDELTGLGNRPALMQALKTELRRSGIGTPGSLCIVHLNDLGALNRTFGRTAVDNALRQLGTALAALCAQHHGWTAARIRGADFAVLATRAEEPQDVAQQAQQALTEVLHNCAMEANLHLPTVATQVVRGESPKAVLARLDGALAAGIKEGESRIYVTESGSVPIRPVEEQLQEWRAIFEQSFEQLHFSLATFPVAGLEGELLHLESPARLQWNGRHFTAGEFLPWIHCLHLATELDQRVVELALEHIREHDQPLYIHLSSAALSEPGFLSWLTEKLSASEATTRRLGIEFAEDTALRFTDALRLFSARVRTLGCRVGIEHVGNQLGELSRLGDVELDYMKIDRRFVRAIDRNSGNQTLIRTLCAIGHKRQLIIIAEGVSNAAERTMLTALGIDGVTGPGVKGPAAASIA